MAEFELTNRDINPSGNDPIKKQSLGIRWQRIIQASKLSVQDVITCTNYTIGPLYLVLSFVFAADFEDIFQIRGLHPTKIGKRKAPAWHHGALVFAYKGADGLQRSLSIGILPRPKARHHNGADVSLSLKPKQSAKVPWAFDWQNLRGKGLLAPRLLLSKKRKSCADSCIRVRTTGFRTTVTWKAAALISTVCSSDRSETSVLCELFSTAKNIFLPVCPGTARCSEGTVFCPHYKPWHSAQRWRNRPCVCWRNTREKRPMLGAMNSLGRSCTSCGSGNLLI